MLRNCEWGKGKCSLACGENRCFEGPGGFPVRASAIEFGTAHRRGSYQRLGLKDGDEAIGTGHIRSRKNV